VDDAHVSSFHALGQGRDLRRSKTSTFVEKAICSDKQLSALDDQLGHLYKAALASASNNAMLKADQKAWLSLRNQCGDADCLKKAYADRINVLEGTSTPPSPEDFTGTYKTENAEVLVQQTANGRLKFYISAPHERWGGFRRGSIDRERRQIRR
jgi:uncharacterized protein